MEAILSAFGIDARLIIIQMINFGVLLVALWYFLYTPVLTLLEERREKVKKGIVDAEAAEQSRKEAEGAKQEIIASAHRESERIVKQSEEHVAKKYNEITHTAEEKARGIIDSAERAAHEQTKQMHAAAEKEIAKTAILAAERILSEQKQS